MMEAFWCGAEGGQNNGRFPFLLAKSSSHADQRAHKVDEVWNVYQNNSKKLKKKIFKKVIWAFL